MRNNFFNDEFFNFEQEPQQKGKLAVGNSFYIERCDTGYTIWTVMAGVPEDNIEIQIRDEFLFVDGEFVDPDLNETIQHHYKFTITPSELRAINYSYTNGILMLNLIKHNRDKKIPIKKAQSASQNLA